jgi:hypothetical protein
MLGAMESSEMVESTWGCRTAFSHDSATSGAFAENGWSLVLPNGANIQALLLYAAGFSYG